MKYIKLFENFEKPDVNPAGEPDNTGDFDNDPSYYVLTDGRFLIFWEEPFEDMAGETNYYYKYQVGSAEDAKKGDWDKFVDVTFDKVEKLLSPEDKKQHEQEQKWLDEGNAKRSKNWTE
jgi:hypothetical protein